MSEEISPVVARRRIRSDLRRYRIEAGHDQKAAARHLKCNPSRISHLESGRNLPDWPTVVALWDFYRRPPKELLPFWEWVEAAERGTSIVLASKGDPDRFDVYASQEYSASEKLTVDMIALDGLLQVPRYMRPMLHFFDPAASEKELDHRVELRVLRQQALTRESNPLKLSAVVALHVLQARDVPPEVWGTQYEHLLELTAPQVGGEASNVELWVVPDRQFDGEHRVIPGALRSVHAPFTILHFPYDGDPGLVYVDAGVKGVLIEDATEIKHFEDLHERLRHAALPPARSRQLIEEFRKDVM